MKRKKSTPRSFPLPLTQEVGDASAATGRCSNFNNLAAIIAMSAPNSFITSSLLAEEEE